MGWDDVIISEALRMIGNQAKMSSSKNREDKSESTKESLSCQLSQIILISISIDFRIS